jgi:hypothetical protein
MGRLATDLRRALDPVAFAVEALSLRPDPWQERVLRATAKRLLLNCSRQAGKSTIAGVLALHRALFFPASLVLLVSPSMRQSAELFRKVIELLERLPNPPKRTEDNRLSFTFENGSRVVSLPSSENTVRGYSAVSLIIEDEASWVGDELYRALRPMLAVSGGRIVLMSTPFGQRGHFYAEWTSGGDTWTRVRITAHDVPRIAPSFLEEEHRSLGAWRFAQEYLCEFVATIDQVFALDHVLGAISPDVAPLTSGAVTGECFMGVDLGQARDYSAIVVIERVSLGAAPSPRRPYLLTAGDSTRAADEDQRRSSGTTYHVRHLERLPLGTPYPVIVARVAAFLASDALRGRATLIVDATGVGRPVVDLFDAAGLYPVRVTITGGDSVTEAHGDLRVPKRDLVTALQVFLHEGRLKVAASLPEKGVLVDELLAFRAKIDPHTAHDSYGAHGEGVHDDLVLALALAAWRARTTETHPPLAVVPGVSTFEEPSEDEDGDQWVMGPGPSRPLTADDRSGARYIGGGVGRVSATTNAARSRPFLVR